MAQSGRGWWDDHAALERFVGDLITGELATIRPGLRVPPAPWPAALTLDEAGLGVDSLDRLKLATALGEAIHFHRSGAGDSLLAQTTFGAWLAAAERSLAAYSAELTFRTSGSTGQPKWCVHELGDLQTEIDVVASWFVGRRRIVTTVPSHHIYGFLFTLLLPARLGIGVIDGRQSSPGGLAARLQPGDLIVGHPDFWAAFVRGVPSIGPGIRGVSSTAPCPPEVARAVVATGVESLVEVYGSSETAGIGRRSDPAAAFELFPYWRRGGHDGELVRLLPGGGSRHIEVPDRLIWVDARHVRPAGRREGAVQVGGHNVFPARVREVLLRHPGVGDAAVRLMRPDEGDRLKAFIVPSDPRAEPARLREALRHWVDERLSAPERPRTFDFGPNLPTGQLGKSADWLIGDAETPALRSD